MGRFETIKVQDDTPHCLFVPGEEYGDPGEQLERNQWGAVLGNPGVAGVLSATTALVFTGTRPEIEAYLRRVLDEITESYKREHLDSRHVAPEPSCPLCGA